MRLFCSLLLATTLSVTTAARAQFIDQFDAATLGGWFTMTGDGQATAQFTPHGDFARIQVDATNDLYTVWWALIKRDITSFIDLTQLQDPAYELRVEARVRPSHAPRRVNFMLNTQRTTDFHEHLREYDLPASGKWHTISFTTTDFEVASGDTVFVQLGVTDWGPGQYHVDVDYYRAEVVRRDSAPPDLGEPLIYHPPVPDLGTFRTRLPVAHDAVLHADFPDVNFNDWQVAGPSGAERVLTIAAPHDVVLRWDFGAFCGQPVEGAGILELTTHSLPRGGRYVEHFGEDLGIEFGKIRVFEILAGDPAWDQENVTLNSLLQGRGREDVFNGQMTIDFDLAEEPGAKTHFPLPRPVMQRLLDGTTKGLLLRPLGALTPSIYASEDAEGRGPRLYFNTSRPSPAESEVAAPPR